MATFRRDEERMLTRLWGKDPPERVADEPAGDAAALGVEDVAGERRAVEEALEQARATLEAGNASEAGSIYGQVLQHEPGNVKAIAGMSAA